MVGLLKRDRVERRQPAPVSVACKKSHGIHKEEAHEGR